MRPTSTGPYRPLVTALAALALIAVAAACSLPSIGARPVYDDSNWASYPQVTQLLAHRTQAMLKRDEKAYLQDLDPKAHDLVAHERMVFANLRQLQFAQLRYRLHGTREGDNLDRLASTEKENTYGQNVTVAPVTVLMQLQGVDDEPTATMYRYFLGQSTGTWRIVDIKPIRHDDPRKARLINWSLPGMEEALPWDLQPLRVIQAADATLLADSTVADLAPYARAATAASARVRQVWGAHPAPRGFAVFLTADTEHFRQWFGGVTPQFADGLAFPAQPVNAGDVPELRYVGARVTVNLANQMDQQPQLVLQHEFTHAVSFAVQIADLPALDKLPGSGVARWALEGFARWVESIDAPGFQQSMLDQLRAGVRAGRFTGQPPGVKQMYTATLDGTAFNYALGFSFWSYVARRWGAAKAVEAYVEYAKVGELADTGGFSFELTGAMRKALGGDAGTLPRDWTAYVRQL